MARFPKRAHVLLMILGITFSNSLFRPGSAFPNGIDYYSTLQEYQTCDHIIPRFIEQVMNQHSPKCDETGAFPKPGNCTVFFKCIRSNTYIQPFMEYCALGYNFVGGVCIPNTNTSDCPQYTCRIPDLSDVNEIGSDAKPNYNDDVRKDVVRPVEFVPLVTLPSVSDTTEPASETTTRVDDTTQQSQRQETVHSEQFMSMTQKEKNSGSSSFLLISKFLILSCALCAFFDKNY
ncbi:unnamed protein product [Orchesella dallaii]|uniref:Chitin-binding type-2 domain-containing protein n=1 Tax=Orchesella dallaii TaxID=48710 RepID=A0ABP1QAX0_9HEXA